MEIANQADSLSSSPKDFEFYGYSKQGAGAGKFECQDSYSVIHELEPGTHFFAVYDGHGSNGKQVSLFVNKHVEEALKANVDKVKKVADQGYVEKFFKDFFNIVDSRLQQSNVDTYHGGTCCNAVFISDNTIYALNVGDSRSVLCRSGKAMNLSKDQKPTRSDERERVQQMGGIVEKRDPNGILRCWDHERRSGLAMTRTFGDASAKEAGVIPEPEVFKYAFQEGDSFIIVASDGVWDVMSSDEAVAFVNHFQAAGNNKGEAAKALAQEARRRWEEQGNPTNPYCDDITVVLAFPK